MENVSPPPSPPGTTGPGSPSAAQVFQLASMLFLITDTTLLSQLRSLEVVVPRNLLVSLLYVLAFDDEQFQRVSLLAEVNHHFFSLETFERKF